LHGSGLLAGGPEAAFAQDGAEGLQKVNHVIVLMQENHSFDNYFWALSYAPRSPYHSPGRSDDDGSGGCSPASAAGPANHRVNLHCGQPHEMTYPVSFQSRNFAKGVCLPNLEMRGYGIKSLWVGVVVKAAKFTLMVFLFFCCGNAFAQSADADKEPALVIELGGAASRSLTDAESSFGPTVAVEVTPIENWLELEAALRRFSAVTRQNGAPTFCSRSPGPCPRKSSLWQALVRNGFIRTGSGRQQTQ
jgi:hypothetical protein